MRKTSDQIPIDALRLGGFANDAAAAAIYMHVGQRQFSNLMAAGTAPEKYARALHDMGTRLVFPIDEPLSEKVIGTPAFRAFQALREGDPKQGAVLSEPALHTHYRDWETGEVKQTPVLHQFFGRLTLGIAWSQHTKFDDVPDGLPKLSALRRDVAAHMKRERIEEGSPEWKAWKYLKAMTLAYALSAYVMRVGSGTFLKAPRREALQNSEKRRKYALKVLRCLGGIAQLSPKFKRQHVGSLVAWNVAQLASVAKDETLFIQALEVLQMNYGKNFSVIRTLLEDDGDTGPLLQSPRVARFVQRAESTPRSSTTGETS